MVGIPQEQKHKDYQEVQEAVVLVITTELFIPVVQEQVDKGMMVEPALMVDQEELEAEAEQEEPVLDLLTLLEVAEVH